MPPAQMFDASAIEFFEPAAPMATRHTTRERRKPLAEKQRALAESTTSALYPGSHRHPLALTYRTPTESVLADAPPHSHTTEPFPSESGSNIPDFRSNASDWLSLNLDDALKPFLREPIEAWFSAFADARPNLNNTASATTDREDGLENRTQTTPPPQAFDSLHGAPAQSPWHCARSSAESSPALNPLAGSKRKHIEGSAEFEDTDLHRHGEMKRRRYGEDDVGIQCGVCTPVDAAPDVQASFTRSPAFKGLVSQIEHFVEQAILIAFEKGVQQGQSECNCDSDMALRKGGAE